MAHKVEVGHWETMEKQKVKQEEKWPGRNVRREGENMWMCEDKEEKETESKASCTWSKKLDSVNTHLEQIHSLLPRMRLTPPLSHITLNLKPKQFC